MAYLSIYCLYCVGGQYGNFWTILDSTYNNFTQYILHILLTVLICNNIDTHEQIKNERCEQCTK